MWLINHLIIGAKASNDINIHTMLPTFIAKRKKNVPTEACGKVEKQFHWNEV